MATGFHISVAGTRVRKRMLSPILVLPDQFVLARTLAMTRLSWALIQATA